jgi:hypothetical protein
LAFFIIYSVFIVTDGEALSVRQSLARVNILAASAGWAINIVASVNAMCFELAHECGPLLSMPVEPEATLVLCASEQKAHFLRRINLKLLYALAFL